MIHLIRHGPKAWDNGQQKSYPYPTNDGANHDPPLDYDGCEADLKCMRLADRLLNQEDAPSMIIASPFLRCRQTAELMNSRLVFHDEERLSIINSSLFREYLGNWRTKERVVVELSQETYLLLHSADPILETWEEFQERMKTACKFVKHTMDSVVDKGDSIWIISHRIVIRQLAKMLRESDYPVACHFMD